MTKANKILIGILVAVILIGSYVFLNRRIRQSQTVTQSVSLASTTQTTAGKGYTISTVPIKPKNFGPIPDINRPIIFAGFLAADVQAMVIQKISYYQNILKKNPSDYDSWISLGLYQKVAGDFAGTDLSWQYAAKLQPNNPLALGNLANLYGYFINDTAKAENYYSQAISKDPSREYLYVQWAEFDRDILKDKGKEMVAILQGLQVIPNDPTLLQLKSAVH